MENCYALPFQLNAASTLKKKQEQFILLARPRGCQNSNCLRVKKSASTSGPPKPLRTVWVQLSYPLSEKLPKVTGSESRAYYKIWLQYYQSLMLLNTTKFLCPKIKKKRDLVFCVGELPGKRGNTSYGQCGSVVKKWVPTSIENQEETSA